MNDNNENWYIKYEKMINGEKKIINTYGRIVDENEDTFIIEEDGKLIVIPKMNVLKLIG